MPTPRSCANSAPKRAAASCSCSYSAFHPHRITVFVRNRLPGKAEAKKNKIRAGGCGVGASQQETLTKCGRRKIRFRVSCRRSVYRFLSRPLLSLSHPPLRPTLLLSFTLFFLSLGPPPAPPPVTLLFLDTLVLCVCLCAGARDADLISLPSTRQLRSCQPPQSAPPPPTPPLPDRGITPVHSPPPPTMPPRCAGWDACRGRGREGEVRGMKWLEGGRREEASTLYPPPRESCHSAGDGSFSVHVPGINLDQTQSCRDKEEPRYGIGLTPTPPPPQPE